MTGKTNKCSLSRGEAIDGSPVAMGKDSDSDSNSNSNFDSNSCTLEGILTIQNVLLLIHNFLYSVLFYGVISSMELCQD